MPRKLLLRKGFFRFSLRLLQSQFVIVTSHLGSIIAGGEETHECLNDQGRIPCPVRFGRGHDLGLQDSRRSRSLYGFEEWAGSEALGGILRVVKELCDLCVGRICLGQYLGETPSGFGTVVDLIGPRFNGYSPQVRVVVAFCPGEIGGRRGAEPAAE